MRILAFDPGGTTGWAFHELVLDKMTGAPLMIGGQLGPVPHHLELWQLIMRLNPDVIVYEDFQYRIKRDHEDDGSVLPAGIVLVSVEYIGIIKLSAYASALRGVKLWCQLPAHGKGFWTNDKLKKIGVYAKGCQHQNDATRHLLHYITEGPLMRKDYLHAFKPTKYKLSNDGA